MKPGLFRVSWPRGCALAFFIGISHVFLPHFSQKSEVFPFFTWDLFREVATPGRSFDLRFSNSSQESFFFLAPEMRQHLTSPSTWFSVQKIGRRALRAGHLSPEDSELLRMHLQGFPLEGSVELVRIKGYLAQHIRGDIDEASIQVLGKFQTP